jgi:penicillin-binding protein 2
MERTGRLTTPRAQRVRRSRGARAVVILTIMLLTGALARLQVVQGKSRALEARTNRMRPLTVPAPRGTIYDRHGQVIAENVPAYEIQIMPDEISTRKHVPSAKMMSQIDSLRPILGLRDDQVKAAIRKWAATSNYPLMLMKDAPAMAVARLEERRYMFPGVILNQYAKRHYPAGAAIAHMIGYVAEIRPSDTLQARFKGYEQGRWIGIAGLEREYEEVLGGKPGKRYMEVNAAGNILKWLPESESTPAVPGRDMQLYLDLDLQRYIEKIFPKDKNGAFVAIDPETGGVLAYYSHPSYDPNAFVGGILSKDFDVLNTDPNKPLLDRVGGSKQPPASTWKLMMAAMALDLGVIKANEVMPISCSGGMAYQGRYAKCWGVHGPQDLMHGILNSCDVYFYQVGIRIGLKRFMSVGTKMGFQKRTGIDLPNEVRPIFPESLQWYANWFRNGYIPADNEIMSLSIGQSVITMTPIKMAQMYVALARPDGVSFEPRVAVTDEPPRVSFQLHVNDADLDVMRRGMRRVLGPGGTAALSRVQNWDLIGKTGSAQSCGGCPPSTDHAWFVGMGGPKGEHPKIVAAMFLEYGVHGATASGYAAKAINFYLDRKYNRPFNPHPIPRDGYQYGGDWAYAPIVDYEYTDTAEYPTIEKIQAEWAKKGKQIEGLAAAADPNPAPASDAKSGATPKKKSAAKKQ